MNPEVYHTMSKNNATIDIPLKARYEGESDMVSDDEDITLD